MKLALVSLTAAAVLGLMLAVAPARAADQAAVAAPPALAVRQIDDNDDTRVAVQLTVAGIAAFVVVGVGLGAYLLRRRLGLVEPPPEQTPGGHH